MQQLTIFDFLPSSEAQADEIPVLKEAEPPLAPDLIAIRWSTAYSIAHLSPKEHLSPICGAREGKAGFYGNGTPYTWQICTRGLTPICEDCKRLEHVTF